jgi:uncharacterized protein YkwD
MPDHKETAMKTLRPPYRHPALGLAVALAAGSFLACQGAGSPTSPSAPANPASVEAASASMVNSERGGNGIGLLGVDPVLCEVAREYSKQLQATGSLNHYDANGQAVDARVRAMGISFRVVGENLASVSGVSDPAREAHKRFMASASHRSNILEPRFDSVGVGVVSDGSTYWITQIFVGN